jgi:hypothetical protein
MTLVGADLPASHGGLGTTTGSADACRLECVKRPVCHHWTHIKDWKVDCHVGVHRGEVPRGRYSGYSDIVEETSGAI